MNEKAANGIWVFTEINSGEIHSSTFELLGKAQELKHNKNDKVTAILLDTGSSDHVETLIGYGADEVIVVENERFSVFNPMVLKDAIVKLAYKYDPAIFLFAATFKGRSLAPRVQGALRTGLSADCLDLSINSDGQLVQIKPSYGDNLMCTILIPNSRPQMTTVRPNVFKPLVFDAQRTGAIVREEVALIEASTYEVIDTRKIDFSPNSIRDAKHIVAAGRGMKSKDNLIYLETLAKQLNAKIGVTRPLAENGWYTIEEQIGQSGYTIQPDLILNFGISGSVQYTVGMKDSKFVFSVNTDESASIFKESDYGYIGDAKTFAQELSKVLENQ